MFSNTVILGRVTADPELKQTPNGVSVTSFSVAVDRPYSKDKQVDFYTVVAWRQTAEFVSRYFSKGNPILVHGSMQSRKYTDKNGNERTVWELVADRVSFTGNKSNNDNPTDDYPDNISATDDFTEIDDDGDLPF